MERTEAKRAPHLPAAPVIEWEETIFVDFKPLTCENRSVASYFATSVQPLRFRAP